MRIIFGYIFLSIVTVLLNGCFLSSQDEEKWIIEPLGTTSFALSKSANFALLYSKKYQLLLWDLKENKKLAFLGNQDSDGNVVSYIRISDNGRYAITSTQLNFVVWDLSQAQAEGLWSISDGLIRDIDIANNGEKVLLGLSNGKAIYVNLATGYRLEFLAHREKVNSVAISPNGKYALTGGNDHKAYFWSTETGQLIRVFEHKARVNQVALHHDGKYAFTSGGESILWDLSSGKKMSTLTALSRQLVFSSARFSPDGQYLATGSPNGRVMLWDSESGKRIQQWEVEPLKEVRPPRAVVYDVAFDNQNRVVSSTSAGIAQAWKIKE